jgi:hypothetical protein
MGVKEEEEQVPIEVVDEEIEKFMGKVSSKKVVARRRRVKGISTSVEKSEEEQESKDGLQFIYYVSARGVVYFKNFASFTTIDGIVHKKVEIAIRDEDFIILDQSQNRLESLFFESSILTKIKEGIRMTSNPSEKADILLTYLKPIVRSAKYE